jgi:hypothetical protein
MALKTAQAEALGHTRTLNGRFALSNASSLPEQGEGSAVSAESLDPGPVASGQPSVWEDAPLDLTPIEDEASIQLALIDVVQALAANRIDPKRAGLLLYALQVASANAKHMRLPMSGGVRTVTYTEDGTPLAPQAYS